MPKKLPDDITEQVLETLRAAPEGLAIEALSDLFGAHISRRALQRLLAGLVQTGLLHLDKRGRSSRYFAPPQAPTDREEYVPLSPSGAEVRQAVRRPLSERAPVSYQHEFLDRYRPNESRYLTPATVSHLTRLGQTPDAERPAGTYARNILARLLVDLSWASSRLEGNTYSLLDTRRLIEEGQAAEGKDAAETQMILNHKAAIEYLVELGDELLLY